MSELQSGVSILRNTFYGNLNYVADYTGFSSKPEEQSGHYLVIKANTMNPTDTITVELIGGTLGHPVTLDEDRNIVLRIADPATQEIEVVASDGEHSETKRFKLTGLTLEN